MSDISGILEEMTTEDVKALAANVAVLPLGSTEPHGPALPYGTDTFTIDAVAKGAVRLANRRGGRVLCYPTLPITLNNNFRKFPFACRIGVKTFMAALTDIIDQLYADGIRRVVLLNGHGGTTEAIHATLRDLAGRDDIPFVCAINGWEMVAPVVAVANVTHPSDHAGEAEVSAQMHLHPDLVRRDKLADNPRNQPTLEGLRGGKVYFVRPWHLYVPASAGGDQREASAERGKALLDSRVENLARFLVELSQAPESATFPY